MNKAITPNIRLKMMPITPPSLPARFLLDPEQFFELGLGEDGNAELLGLIVF
jgi:hypothetical protein